MSLSRTRMLTLVIAFVCSTVPFLYPSNLAAAPPGAPPQPEAQIAGAITIRNGEVMNVKIANGKIVEVVLNPDTKIEKPVGVMGFRKRRLDVTALAPGLSVAVQGMQYENDQLAARIVTVSGQSLHSANAVPSAAAPGPKVNLADYGVKATVLRPFAPGRDAALLRRLTAGRLYAN